MPPSDPGQTKRSGCGEAEALVDLQQAAHDLIGAARTFLDTIERFVDDPTRFEPAARRVADGIASAWAVAEPQLGNIVDLDQIVERIRSVDLTRVNG